MLQFDWLFDVCECVVSLTSGIYWVELGFINNCNEPQLWLVLLKYRPDVVNAFPWVVIIGFCDQVTSWSSSCDELGAVHWKGEIVTIEQVQLGIRVRVQL